MITKSLNLVNQHFAIQSSSVFVDYDKGVLNLCEYSFSENVFAISLIHINKKFTIVVYRFYITVPPVFCQQVRD